MADDAEPLWRAAARRWQSRAERAEASEQHLRDRLEALAAAWDDCPDHLVHSFIQRLRANLEDQP